MINQNMPRGVLAVIDRLEHAGYEAYAVGGAVRDMIRGQTPHDFDVATAARPEDVMYLFDRVVPTGLKYGTVTVLWDDMAIEVTTFRHDGRYKDGRRPDRVFTASCVEDDLARRDFTMNAIAWSPKSQLTDPFGGFEDIQKGLIRAVGDPFIRFGEDALRILRAFRFAAQLHYIIETKTREAALALAGSLSNVSAERVGVELLKTLNSAYPSALTPLVVSSALVPWGIGCCDDLAVLDQAPSKAWVRLGALCYVTRSDCDVVCEKLKLSRLISKQTYQIYDGLVRSLPTTDQDLRRVMGRIGFEQTAYIIRLHAVILNEPVDILEEKLQLFHRRKDACRLDMLAVSGKDLAQSGVMQGTKVGNILEGLLELVLENPALNQKEYLLKRARELERNAVT